jgi:hypothetical protein
MGPRFGDSPLYEADIHRQAFDVRKVPIAEEG